MPLRDHPFNLKVGGGMIFSLYRAAETFFATILLTESLFTKNHSMEGPLIFYQLPSTLSRTYSALSFKHVQLSPIRFVKLGGSTSGRHSIAL